MAIDTPHPDYETRIIQWNKLRDCIEGQEAIHDKKKKYLPGLSGQSDTDYMAYMERALFYGATSRTVDGLSGMVFRKPPMIEVPAGLEPHIQDVTLDGLDLMGFAEQIIDDDIAVGRAGILVDHPATGAGVTVAQAEAMNNRPFLKHYTAEQIFNWKTESRNNAQVLVHLRLWEWVEQINPADEFEVETIRQIRVLDLIDGAYRQRVFRQNDKKEWVLFEEVIPLKANAPLDTIPFFFVGVKNGSAKCEKPPLIDLANANLSHYKSTADLEHGAHFTGLPTAVITGDSGLDDEGEPTEYVIGSTSAWVFPNSETDVKYLEFEGQGLDALEKRIAKKEEYMAFLGARMLSPDKKGVEAAETAQIHRTGEVSVLASLVQSAGQSLEDAVKFMAEWAGIETGEISITLNNDFMAVKMSAQDLQALFQTYQGGGMAFSDFLHNLKRGEIIQEDREEDEILSEIEVSNPFMADDFDKAANDDTVEL